jgi:heptaprenyl diphosphate synthase
MPFELQSIKEEVTYLNEQVYKKVSAAYLNKYVECPIIEEDKAVFLYGLLKQCNYPHLQNAYMAVMLVDLALTLHEEVPISNSQESDVKNRQLTVLGGDYYSSLYYNELAKIGDLKLIKIVADAIQEINEEKMNVYLNKSNLVEDNIKGIQKIHSYLFVSIANELDCSEWAQFATNYFLLKMITLQGSNVVEVKDEYKRFQVESKDVINLKVEDLTKKLSVLLKNNKPLNQLFSQSLEKIKLYENRLVKATGEGL